MTAKKMDAVRAALLAIPSSSTSNVNVMMGDRDQRDVTVTRLQITEDVAAEFAQIAQNAGWWDGTDYELRPYDPGYKPDKRDVIYAAFDEVPGMAELIAMCESPSAAELFDGSDEAIRRLAFYVIVGGTTRKHTYWIRSYSARRELTRGIRLAIVNKRGSYDTLKSDVFTFDALIDCIVHDSFVFVRSVPAFERIFDLLEAVRAQAAASVEHICQYVPVVNADDFKAACRRDALMSSRAVQIAQRTYLQTLTMADIKRTIERHNLPIRLDGDSLVFEPASEKRWLILRVLDDAYLDSTMTGLSYEVNSKAPLVH